MDTISIYIGSSSDAHFLARKNTIIGYIYLAYVCTGDCVFRLLCITSLKVLLLSIRCRKLDEEKLRLMSDEEIHSLLTSVKGIGGWTYVKIL